MYLSSWDTATFKYKLAESPQKLSGGKDDWEEYLFIERRQFGSLIPHTTMLMLMKPLDKKNVNFSTFLDIKSEVLRDILREVLKDVRGVNLREDKPTVSFNIHSK